ncbi:MAG TPA: hypothetical protein VNK41_01040 [Vicinamibacterales bacterium]|nr:hypothetical protein [Vicinamibacterales bacterium]
MSKVPAIVFCISGHGFGHASRDVEVINTLYARHPDWKFVVRTAAPRWFFDTALRAPIEWESVECDPGVVQVDSLHVDVEATLHRAASFYATLDERVRAEAPMLEGAALVVGDIPPLACAAARAAGVPCLALGNFTWDWIYENYEESPALAPGLVQTIREAYGHASGALRLPLHGGFSAFRAVVDVPFIARRSRRDRAELRAWLGVPLDSRLVLASFGGYGVREFDMSALARLDGFTVLVTADIEAERRGSSQSQSAPAFELPDTVRYVDERALRASGFAYEDLVAAVDVVATKPGYGIIAECAANGAAMLYTSRGRFPEYDVLVRGMPRYIRSEFISPEDLVQGRWQEPLERLVSRPPAPETPDVSGAEVVAGIIESFVL